MGDSKIEWTDMTWNPVTGCTKVSTGCKHCYAERLFPRVYGKDQVTFYTGEGEFTRPRTFTDVKLHPERLEQPLHWKKPRMIFVNSMSDLFHEDVPFEFIDKIFAVMACCPQHTFQILTKRPKRMKEYFDRSEDGLFDCISPRIHDKYLHQQPYKFITANDYYDSGNWCGWHEIQFPDDWLKHIWLGISCENQATADERIPILLQVPAVVRFLSCEPLLDEIDLHEWHGLNKDGTPDYKFGIRCIDWVIVGGESGPGYRPMNPEWAKSIIEQCQAARVPVFMKQMAGKKEIPEYLKIREYPNGRN